MTQVKEWSNKELNRKLAVLMGYSVIKYSMPPDPDGYNWSLDYYKLIDSKGAAVETSLETEDEAWSEAPDYSTDAAASLEVEQAAIKDDAIGYMRNLATVKWGRPDAGEMTELSLIGAADLHLATPRERAEAAYITLREAK